MNPALAVYDEIGVVKHTLAPGQVFFSLFPRKVLFFPSADQGSRSNHQVEPGSTSHVFDPAKGTMISRFKLPLYRGRQGAHSLNRG